jgi:hypothetical protein
MMNSVRNVVVVSALSSTGRKRVTALGRNLPVRHITPPLRLDHYGKTGGLPEIQSLIRKPKKNGDPEGVPCKSPGPADG